MAPPIAHLKGKVDLLEARVMTRSGQRGTDHTKLIELAGKIRTFRQELSRGGFDARLHGAQQRYQRLYNQAKDLGVDI